MSRYLCIRARVCVYVRLCGRDASRCDSFLVFSIIIHANTRIYRGGVNLSYRNDYSGKRDLSLRCRGSTAADHVLSTTFPSINVRARVSPLNIALYV